jgi:hypothetical protein
MTEKEFDLLIYDTLDQIQKILIVKGKEYRRNNNPFHNFERGSSMTGKTREEIISFFKLKHDISVQDMINDLKVNKLPTIEVVDEKFNDILIYTLLQKASIIDKVKNGI